MAIAEAVKTQIKSRLTAQEQDELILLRLPSTPAMKLHDFGKRESKCRTDKLAGEDRMGRSFGPQ